MTAWQPPPVVEGPPGRVRSTGRCVLLTVVTLGIYVWVWTYQVHGEMKRHTGRGLGGGVALLIAVLASPVAPFLSSAEVGALYTRRGLPAPVTGITGLWLVGPGLGGYLLVVAVGLGLAVAAPDAGEGPLLAALLVAVAVYLLGTVIGGLVWFAKTNGALNAYWARGTSAPATAFS